MSCKLKHKDALLNSRDFLLAQGAIDKLSTILNSQKFEEANIALSSDALDAYGVEGNLWNEKSGRAVPNKSVLKSIDDKRKELGIYDSQEAGAILSVQSSQPFEIPLDETESIEEVIEDVDYISQDFVEQRDSTKRQNQLLGSSELGIETFDEMFPDMDYLTEADKLTLIKAIEDGQISISCAI